MASGAMHAPLALGSTSALQSVEKVNDPLKHVDRFNLSFTNRFIFAPNPWAARSRLGCSRNLLIPVPRDLQFRARALRNHFPASTASRHSRLIGRIGGIGATFGDSVAGAMDWMFSVRDALRMNRL